MNRTIESIKVFCKENSETIKKGCIIAGGLVGTAILAYVFGLGEGAECATDSTLELLCEYREKGGELSSDATELGNRLFEYAMSKKS
jgi:hypothetical protein